MTVVIDASVLLKWILRAPDVEADTSKAIALMQQVVTGVNPILQPPHWLGEVGAVLARLTPRTAVREVGLLGMMEFPTTTDINVLERATQLALETGQHFFDTWYHAVALEHEDSVFITADMRYFAAARDHGRIMPLRLWSS